MDPRAQEIDVERALAQLFVDQPDRGCLGVRLAPLGFRVRYGRVHGLLRHQALLFKPVLFLPCILACASRICPQARLSDRRLRRGKGTGAGLAVRHRRLDELIGALKRGDRLVVSELSRLGRSLGQVVAVLDGLVKAGVAFIAIKENIRVEGKQDIQTKVMTTLFALFAEVERDLISERTREGLAKARASGKKLGRPKGSLGVSRLDGKEDEIRQFIDLGVSKSAIARITGVSRQNLYHFIRTRGIAPGP